MTNGNGPGSVQPQTRVTTTAFCTPCAVSSLARFRLEHVNDSATAWHAIAARTNNYNDDTHHCSKAAAYQSVQSNIPIGAKLFSITMDPLELDGASVIA